jgi:hypothetical protein
MRSQSKHRFPQLNLPLLDAHPTVPPSDRDEELVEALVELLLAAAGHPDGRLEGGQDEPEADL